VVLQDFEKRAAAVVSELMKKRSSEILLIHHDDADGLCSAAITKTALEREGFAVKRLCLEKVYREVVADLHQRANQTVFYCDIGSAHADLISSVNTGRNLTIILDHHHEPPDAIDPLVFDMNLERYGFNGDTEFSGATCSYLFARILNPANTDLSYLALVGSREIPNDLAGLNKTVLDEASMSHVIRIEGRAIKIIKLGMSVDSLFAKLQILGAVGYYENGPELGIQTCIEGMTDDVKKEIQSIEDKRKKANKQLIGRLYRERLTEMQNLQWFNAGDMYKGMGTKVIGQFCSFLSYQTRLVKPDKYILGFMNVLPKVPGWEGELEGRLVKVSIRVPRALHELIDKAERRNAVDVAVRASQGFGSADGHRYAANVVMQADMKEALLKRADSVALL
jgi:single-stranded-DNA-specific exonuclease